MKQKITLKKIAQELNVSISTVSKALKDSTEIGVETHFDPVWEMEISFLAIPRLLFKK